MCLCTCARIYLPIYIFRLCVGAEEGIFPILSNYLPYQYVYISALTLFSPRSQTLNIHVYF